MTDQVGMGRAASVAFGSFGVLYGGVAVAAGARVRLWATCVSGANVQKHHTRVCERKHAFACAAPANMVAFAG